MRFAYLSDDMAHLVRLFDDIYLEGTGKGTVIPYRGEKVISPYEYHYFWRLSPKSCALKRYGQGMVDIVFRSGHMFFGAYCVHEIGGIWREDENGYLIAIMIRHGTLVMDDSMNVRCFIPGYPRIAIIEDMFLVAYLHHKTVPRVRVYDLEGEFLAEGELWDAIDKARSKIRGY
jgi:hypothetical protein